MNPWDNEPEGPHLFSHHGLQCAVLRGPMKAWNGYVGVPKDHPFFGLDYDAPAPGKKFSDVSDTAVGKRGVIALVLAASDHDDDSPISILTLIDVHGSLTYASEAPRGVPNMGLWWFGFDTSHYGDLAPGNDWTSDGVYRNLEYVKSETRRLAEQLHAQEAS